VDLHRFASWRIAAIGDGNRKAFWCYPAEEENDIDKLYELLKEYLTACMSGQ